MSPLTQTYAEQYTERYYLLGEMIFVLDPNTGPAIVKQHQACPHSLRIQDSTAQWASRFALVLGRSTQLQASVLCCRLTTGMHHS
jgi:hypothetical protein